MTCAYHCLASLTLSLTLVRTNALQLRRTRCDLITYIQIFNGLIKAHWASP